MFGIFKKKKLVILSPAKGMLKDITKVKDDAFSSKCLGEGFAIEPSKGEVYSPVEGVIATVFPTNHAIIVKAIDEKEILIHIGLDSVKLEGKGFTALIEVGQKVSAGQKLMKFDLDLLNDKIPSSDIIVVFTNGEKCNLVGEERNVEAGEDNIVVVE